jgi:hypothetical protein
MGWIYFQESAGSRSGSGRGSDPSHIVSETGTLRACCLVEWLTAYCHAPQYGTTLPPSRDGCCLEESISFSEAFPARTFPLPDGEPDWAASEAGLSARCGDWLMKYDRDTSSWKMCQQSLMADWTASLPRLPNAGLMRGGYVFPLPTWARAISGNDGGCLRIAKTLPTPTARDWKDGTAQACANVPDKGLLGRRVHRLATPLARDYRTGQASRLELPNAQRHLNDQLDGRLSPLFVEQMMGYRIGWTELSAWAIPWCRRRQRRLSQSSPVSSIERDPDAQD